MGVLCSALVLGLGSGVGGAAGSGRIQGIVQRAGQALTEQRIMLIRFGPEQEVQRTPGQTDAAGRFLFDNLEPGAAFTYVVGVRYQEQLYRSNDIVLQSDAPVEVVLDVDEALPAAPEGRGEPSRPHIVNHLVVLVERDTALEAREIVRIVNPGTTPYIEPQSSAATAGISLRLPLPAGYYNLSEIHGLTQAHVRADSTGLSYVTPLAPGEHRIMYTYSLPWPATFTTLLLQRTLDTATLEVLVEEKQLVTTSDLQFGGRVTIDPRVFVHFRGINLTARSRSWLQLLPQRPSRISWLPLGAYSLIIGIALSGIAIPLRHLWRGRSRPAPAEPTAPESRPLRELQRAGAHWLQSLASLDDQYDHGRLAESVYLERRRSYKEQLVKVVTDFQSQMRQEHHTQVGEQRNRV